ncbi:hypothetical protein Bca4012_051566 [Brassica carinata]|uniref:(rape) hypothetical protein n=1 Tax=Brassica napus TaxID=3708 RepID=A0A816K2J5_BRANA|nr:unnamed protein product [Brassica napus]
MRQAEEQGDFEETAARMVRASLDNQILVPQSPNNPQISTHERISALQRLGTSRLLISIWGNLVGFYVINFLFSAIPSSGMYTIMFRLCSQPSYWITMFLIIGAGMGPIFALKYYRYTYRPSKINILQQAERTGGPIVTIGNIETQPRTMEKEVSPLPITQPKNRSPVYEPLLSESPNATRRSFGPGTPLEFFQSQSRLSSSSGYSRNCKDN